MVNQVMLKTCQMLASPQADSSSSFFQQLKQMSGHGMAPRDCPDFEEKHGDFIWTLAGFSPTEPAGDLAHDDNKKSKSDGHWTLQSLFIYNFYIMLDIN